MEFGSTLELSTCLEDAGIKKSTEVSVSFYNKALHVCAG